MDSTDDKRRANGQFAPGCSGNPSGKPRQAITALREQLAEGAEDVARSVLEAAKDGDMAAARLVLERVSPPLRAASQPVGVEIPDTATPLQLAECFIRSAASGDLPADIASQLVTAVGGLVRVEEIEELRERLTALERATQIKIHKS